MSEPPGRKIKQRAHALTILAVCWTLFSGIGIFDWMDMNRRFGDPNAWPDIGLWGVHLLIIIAAVRAWMYETPTESVVEEGEALPEDLFARLPTNVDLQEEKISLIKTGVYAVTACLAMFVFAVLSSLLQTNQLPDKKWMIGVGVFCAFLSCSVVIVYTVRYVVLMIRSRKS